MNRISRKTLFLLLVATTSSLPAIGFSSPAFSRYSVEIHETTPKMSELVKDGYSCQRSGGDYICTKKDSPTYVCDGDKCEKLPYPF